MGELIVSISGIADRTFDAVAGFRAELAARDVPASLMVAPRLKRCYRLDTDSRTVDWLLRQRAAQGELKRRGSVSGHAASLPYG